jgi:hypothetical protein
MSILDKLFPMRKKTTAVLTPDGKLTVTKDSEEKEPEAQKPIVIGGKSYIRVKCSTIYIGLPHGEPFSLFNASITKVEEMAQPWEDFCQWYYEKDTPYFIFKYKEGETVILRNSIISFTIKMEEHLKEIS